MVSGWRDGEAKRAGIGGSVGGRGRGGGWGDGFWFHVNGPRGASLVCAGGGRGAVTEGGVEGGIPPHKGGRDDTD